MMVVRLPTPMFLLLAAASVAVLAACAEPDLSDPEAADEAPTEVEDPVLDPARDTLIEEVDALRATVVAASDALDAVMSASDVAAARTAGRTATANLVDDPAVSRGAEATGRPVFPVRTDERGSAGEDDDALTALTTAARNASGPLGGAVTDLLRDPIAGDVGAWSRDPAGMVDLARTAASSSTELPELERAILELPGEGTRALAWCLLVSDASDLEAAAAYAERGQAHLDLIVAAIDALDTTP